MIATVADAPRCTFVAIDVAKSVHEVLVEPPSGRRQRWRIGNCQSDFVALRDRLHAFQTPVCIGFEATGNYHRPLAYYLGQCGFELRLISSLAVARMRDALYNSWDKNDPKDTQVLLHLLKTGVSQRYHDPLVHRMNDLQEFAQTHYQISLRKVQVQHSIMTHYLPLYFPEAERYYCTAHNFLDTVVAVVDPTCGSRCSTIVAPGRTVGVVFWGARHNGLPSLDYRHRHAASDVISKSRRTWIGDRNPCRSTSHCSL